MRTPGITKRRRGVALVEFALSAMVFLMLLFGIIDWAWVFYEHQTIVWRTSDAARWAAANTTDQTSVKNIVLCGTTTACSGGGGMGFYTVSNVAVSHFSTADQVDTTGTVGPLTRYFVQVTVSGYQIRHFIPGFSVTFTGQPITVVQPMECQDGGGNCYVAGS